MAKRRSRRSFGTLQSYRCRSCSPKTAECLPDEKIREHTCPRCLLKEQRSALHKLRRLLSTREQQRALQRYIGVSRTLTNQVLRQSPQRVP